MSREVPQLCKVAPNTQKYHIEDVHRAGGIMGILGELDRAGKLHTDVPTVHAPTMKDALDEWDIMRNPSEEVMEFYKAGPAGIPTQVAFSQATRWPTLDGDRENGCIRSLEMPSLWKVVWPYCAATSRWTAVWLSLPVWTSPSWCSKALHTSPNPRTRLLPTSWTTR